MARRLFWCILAALACGAQSPAQPAGPEAKRDIRWSGGIEEAKAAARLADAPILVYLHLANHAASMNFEADVLGDADFLSFSKLFVMVKVDGGLHRDVARQFEATRYPTLVYLDSSGEKLHMLESNLTPARVLHYMGRTFLVSIYNGGRRAREAHDIPKAVRRYQTLLMLGRGTPPADWAQRDLREISAEGMKKLSQARIALEAADYLPAMTLLDEVAYDYRGTQAGGEAQKLMNDLAGKPEAVKAMGEVRRRRSAATILARARRLDNDKDVEGALILYWDVTRDYPNTPAASEAARRADELAQDRALALKAARTRMLRDCRQWMEMAQAFAMNDRKENAIAYYQRVIEYYPDTSYARKARQAINDLLGVKPRD
jgi:tetratricopeptide (TPR) repeat protein